MCADDLAIAHAFVSGPWRRFLTGRYAPLLTHGSLMVLTVSMFAILLRLPFWLAFVPCAIIHHRIGVLLHEYIHGIPFTRYRTNLLVLSVYDERQIAVRALRAGAAGYFTKDAPGPVLLEAIRRVHAGKRALSPELAWVDLPQWEEDVTRALAGGSAEEELEPVFTAFPGPLFQAAALPSWALPVAGRVERRYLELADRLARLQAARGQTARARAVYLRALDHYPSAALPHEALARPVWSSAQRRPS